VININIKDHYGKASITREHGARLRSFLDSNWKKTDVFQIDFAGIKIASVSFFDEAFGKLASTVSLEELKGKFKMQSIDDFDLQILNNVIKSRYEREKKKSESKDK